MKSLKDLIIEQKARKGPASGTDKRGAYWIVKAITTRSAGGDGIGQSAPSLNYDLQLRHYRSGDVRAMIERDAWHQNGSYGGGGTSWHGVGGILECTTAEEVIVELLNAGSEETGRLFSESHRGELVSGLAGIGLLEALPAPDETLPMIGGAS